MVKKRETEEEAIDLLQGTLDMLIMQTLVFGAKHGHNIANSIEQTSGEVLKIDHGSLYPALQRLERRGWISSSWGTSENNRKAKFYRLTALGKKQLVKETSKWEKLVDAIGCILKPASKES